MLVFQVISNHFSGLLVEFEFIHLRKTTGPAKQAAYGALLTTYNKLRRADKVCRSEWADRDTGARVEIEELAKRLRKEMGFAGLLGRIGTGLSILGLMVVLARDLVA